MTQAAYTLAGKPVSQEAFYRAACDPQRSVVVEACAGAGKTWLLVSRILRALVAGCEPREILAVTFTRKAAGEMRDRLAQWLAEFAQPACSHDTRVQALQARGLSPSEAQAMAGALGQLQSQLQLSGQSVQVHTFHGWFAQLVLNAPFDTRLQLGLPQRFTLVEDASVLWPALYKRFYARVSVDAALRQDHAELIARHRRSTVESWFNNALANAVNVVSADEAGNLLPSMPSAGEWDATCAGLAEPAALILANPLHGELLALAARMGQAKAAAVRKAAGELVAALELSDPGAALTRAYGALFTQKRMRRVLAEVDGLNAAFDAIEHIEGLVRQQQAHLDHAKVVRLVRMLLREFAMLKAELGLLDMNDVERAARFMLADETLSGWVHEKLDMRLRHVLVDEFQDTNPMQWHALNAWLSGYAGAGGGASGQKPLSVFIVGDPKQSIYRFRGAQPEVFQEAKRFVTEGLDGVVLACDHTRRCAPQVIEQVNGVFSSVAAQGEWQDFRAHTTESQTSGAVRALFMAAREVTPRSLKKDAPVLPWRPSLTHAKAQAEERLRRREGQEVAAAVLELLTQQGFAPGQVMVLARTRDVLRDVSLALCELGVVHVMPEAGTIDEQPEAMDLVALLDALASPGHDLSLARALKSPLLGASDDDLLCIANAAAANHCHWMIALLGTEHTTEVLSRAAKLITRWLALVNEHSPHELIERIVHEGNLLRRMAAAVPAARWPMAQAGVNAVIESALTLDGGRYLTLYGLARKLISGQTKMPPMAMADAVQLLTIHGAKGLESRAVFVVNTDAAPRRTDSGMIHCHWPAHSGVPLSVAFIAREALPPPSMVARLAAERRTQQGEELNALYVAMTRASERLVFSATEGRASAASSWWQRVTQSLTPEATRLGRQPAVAAGSQTAGNALATLPALRKLSTAMRGASAADDDHAVDAARSRLGQAVHRVLEWAGRPQAPVLASHWPGLAAAASKEFRLDASLTEQVLALAKDVLESPDCAAFFGGPSLLWVGTEIALAAPSGVWRVDRVVKREHKGQMQWWVLDYKLHAAPEQVQAYRRQLQQYQQALQKLVPGETVHAAFIASGGRVVEL